MEPIMIRLLNTSDTFKLYTFEIENRKYFKDYYIDRNPSYYDSENFSNMIRTLVAEQDAGLLYMYLILDNKETILGRINLVSVTNTPYMKAEIGYIIGANYCGQGICSKAISLVIQECKSILNLHRLEAGTAPNNKASQKVLTKNGFRYVGTYQKYIYHNNKWNDSLLFELLL